MTVGKLEKILAEIKDKRMKVTVDKFTLWDGNATFNICELDKAEPMWVGLADGDGFRMHTKKGVERGSVQLVLKGDNLK
jgi:hypothetical protein